MSDGKFSCAVYRKFVCNNSVLCSFWKYWLYERCSGTSSMMQYDECNIPTCGSHETNTTECHGTESDMDKFYHLGDK